MSEAIEVPRFLTRIAEPGDGQPRPTGARIEVTAAWIAECRAKQRAYAARRRAYAALYLGEPAPPHDAPGAPLRGKIFDKRQAAMAL